MVRDLTRLGPLSEPLAPYLTADLLRLLQRAPLAGEVRRAVTATVFCLLGQCRDEVVARLRVTLPATDTHLLHTTLAEYRRFHKFTGRV